MGWLWVVGFGIVFVLGCMVRSRVVLGLVRLDIDWVGAAQTE